MRTAKLSVVTFSFLLLLHFASATRKCFKEETTRFSVLDAKTGCKESCEKLKTTCPGYNCICFLEKGDKCLVHTQQSQRRLLVTCSVLSESPYVMKELESEKLEKKVGKELDFDLSAVVSKDNGKPMSSIIAVEKESQEEAFDFFGEVIHIEGLGTDSEALSIT
eukprot:g2262.t1